MNDDFKNDTINDIIIERDGYLEQLNEVTKENLKLRDKLEQHRKEYQETYKDVRIELKEKNKEIDRLNNIINGIHNQWKELSYSSTDYNYKYLNKIGDLSKLKELKEKNND